MALTISVWFDYICPFSVMTRKVLADTVTDPDVTIRWRPLELHPDGLADGIKHDYPQYVWERSVLPMAERLGVRFPAKPAPGLPHTGRALLGYGYAERHGLALAYNDRVFDAFFQEHQDISEPGVLGALAAEVGLDAGEFHTHITSAEQAALYRAAQDEARTALGVHTVPTLTVGPWRTEGVPRPERLLQVIRELAARQPKSAA